MFLTAAVISVILYRALNIWLITCLCLHTKSISCLQTCKFAALWVTCGLCRHHLWPTMTYYLEWLKFVNKCWYSNWTNYIYFISVFCALHRLVCYRC